MKGIASRIVGKPRACAALLFLLGGCQLGTSGPQQNLVREQPQFSIPKTATHTKFSRKLAPVAKVPSGSIVEVFTHEATGGQLKLGSTTADLQEIDFSQVHTITGSIYVEDARPGDLLAVELLELEVADWGWMALLPAFGQLVDEIATTSLRTFRINQVSQTVQFADGVNVPLRPFAGIMGVAPGNDESLDTFPPRANGGNMDNPALTKGTILCDHWFCSDPRRRGKKSDSIHDRLSDVSAWLE